VSIHLANPLRYIEEVMAEVASPPPAVDFEQWAVNNVSFSERESQFAGPYNPRHFKPFTEVYKALGPDDPCRIVTFSKGAQIGGTIVATVFMLGSLDLDPGDFLYVHPTEDNARRWSKLKLSPMIRGSKRLRVMFPEKSRDGADTVLFKERHDFRGSLLITGANSPASLSQVSMRRQVQDDLAKWVPNSAGDPEGQADSRSSAFDFAKVLKISTPLVVPGCRITRAFEDGTQEYYYVPCPHCGTEQTLEIENFIAHIDEVHPENSGFACIECGCIIEEHHRDAIVRAGHWVARSPDKAAYHRSFSLWAAYSPLKRFELIARAWLSARGEPDSEKTFYNDVAGRPYHVKGEAPPWEMLRNRAEADGLSRGVVPHGYLVVTVGVDVNGDWCNWQAVAWSRDHRRYVVDYGRIDGAITDASTMKALDDVLASQWAHESGAKVPVDKFAIDGNAWTEDVWTWAKRHPSYKVIMVRGMDGDNVPLLAKVKRERSRRTGNVLKYSTRFYNFATSILKWSLYRNLVGVDSTRPGYVGFARGLGDTYFRELTAERRIEKRLKGGFTSFGWELPSGERNEALDTMTQAEAAAIKFGVRDLPPAVWDRLESERTSSAAAQSRPAPVPKPVINPPESNPVQQPPRRKLSDIGQR
jgi:phage terminase large subunit GpA-like protein